jgi:archaeosortase A (PGF-CTERM-specific)
MQKSNNSEKFVALMFLLVPTIFVILGLLLFPYNPLDTVKIVEMTMFVPLFSSLVLLGIGFFLKKDKISNKLKMAGWIIFAFYWSTRTNSLYFSEGGDFANAFLCIAGVYVLFYIAYHEWLSLIRNENVECLNWIAGASCIAGFVYFGIENTPLASWLIEIVAAQSGGLLNLFTGNVDVYRSIIFYKGSYIVNIIFACTAIQSMVLFVGMIFPLKKIDKKRRAYGLLVTVVPIYFLNLIRNALVAGLMINGVDFNMAHNVIGKGGSLLALVLLLLIVIKILPELFDEIIKLIDIYKRDGPIERFFKKYFGRKKAA